MNIRSQVYGSIRSTESPLVLTKRPKGARADEILSIPVVRRQGRQGNTRLDERFPLSEELAKVVRRRATHDARIVNVCAGGAMIAADIDPMLWEPVTLHLGEHGAVPCLVLWTRNGRIGLQFAQETQLDCGADDRAALISETILRHFPNANLERAVAATPESADESRSAARHPFVWFGSLYWDYACSPVRVRNISPEGAMLETPADLMAGAEPYLDLGEAGSMFGKIAWTAGDQCGLTFREPFDMARLAHLKPKLAPGSEAIARFGTPRT